MVIYVLDYMSSHNITQQLRRIPDPQFTAQFKQEQDYPNERSRGSISFSRSPLISELRVLFISLALTLSRNGY